jgi:hypothetical protein
LKREEVTERERLLKKEKVTEIKLMKEEKVNK